jgi:type IV pilus assembly protein PilM
MFWDSLLPKNRALVGLDIGSHSVKLIELHEDKKGGFQLRSLGLAQLPPNTIVEGDIKDAAAVSEAIKRLLANVKPATTNVACSISGYSVIVKKITVGKATQEELEETIHWEAEQYIPFDINDVNIDFQILGDSEANPEQMEVMLVAAKKDIINTYSGLLREAGLSPAIIEVDSFAMGNAYELNYPNGDGGTCTALIDIGAEKMNINIVKDGTPALTRDASFGGRQITERIQRERGLSFEEAENLKLAGPTDPDAAQALEEIYLSVLSAWVSEIERSIELFSATYPAEKVGKIILSGGSSRVSGLPELLASGTGLEVEIFNPFAHIEHEDKSFDPAYLSYIGPQLAIGAGLALRKVGDR